LEKSKYFNNIVDYYTQAAINEMHYVEQDFYVESCAINPAYYDDDKVDIELFHDDGDLLLKEEKDKFFKEFYDYYTLNNKSVSYVESENQLKFDFV
jgi:hypothetical protein